MSKAVILNGYGAADVLQVADISDVAPKSDEVMVKQSAIGVNHFDLDIRSGKRTLSNQSDKVILGYEASGVIQEVGPDVKGFSVGDRVAYATAQLGAYREIRCVNQKYLVALPEKITEKIAAASLFKGLAAHYLASRAFVVRSGTAVLIHAATSGVGQILSQIANIKGAVVIGTVGSDEKKQTALEYGCHKVFNYNTEDWVQEVLDITNGLGVNIVYDSLGQQVFEKSLKSLMTMGIMMSYGDVTGPVSSVNISKIREKSLFLASPSIFHYKANRMELVLSAQDVFSLIESSNIKINIFQSFTLDQANEAHKLLESRQVLGSLVLTV